MTSAAAKKSVLVVDDDADIRETLTLVLEDEGYAVASVANGEEALSWLRSHEERPDVILLDLMMPIMDGMEFLKVQMVDPELSKIPVVVFTADSSVPHRQELSTVAGVLIKPVGIAELMDVLVRIC